VQTLAETAGLLRRPAYWRLALAAAVASITGLTLALLSDGESDPGRVSAAPGPVVVRDRFIGAAGTPLSSHAPDVDEVGGGWQQTPGSDFRLTGPTTGANGLGERERPGNGESDRRFGSNGAVRDVTGKGTPYYAIVNAGISDIDLSVDFKRSEQPGEYGLVFRYADASNNLQLVYDGDRLKLRKRVSGVETVLQERAAAWPEGTTRKIRVTDKAGVISAHLGQRELFRSTDATLLGNTRVGLYNVNNSASSVREFEVTALGPQPTPTPEPLLPAVIVDHFDEVGPTPLPLHVPDLAPAGASWTSLSGDWTVASGQAQLTGFSGPCCDRVTAIQTGLTEADITVDMTWNGGAAGISWGVDAYNNRAIAFWDGFFLVAGRIEPSTGSFVEMGRAPHSWAAGQTKKLRVRLNGTNARFYVDDPSVAGDEAAPVILVIGTTMGASKSAGLFSTSAGNLFDNFVVRPSPVLLQPDPVLRVPPPQVLPPVSIPSGAVVYDSFTFYDEDLITNRPPDLDPSGSGWSVTGGRWQFFDFEAGQLEGALDHLAFINTGRDQYEIRAREFWDGGRTGIAFGAYGPDPRNTFLVWKNHDNWVFIGKKIGGVFFTLDTARAGWKAGDADTLRVEVTGDRIRVFQDQRRLFDFRDKDVIGRTWAGLFQNAFHAERYDDFLVKLAPGALPPTPTPVPGPVVFDDFTGADAKFVATYGLPQPPPRTPPTAPSGSVWTRVTERGDWWIKSNAAAESSEFDYGQQDRVVVVNAGIPDGLVSVDVNNAGGAHAPFGVPLNPAFGVVARASADVFGSGAPDFVFWFYDGFGFMVAAKIVNGAFTELGRTGVSWPVGTTRSLGIIVLGATFTFQVDGVTAMTRSVSDPELASNTRFGLFSKEADAVASTTFDNFLVRPY
jgi:hypothetical protein